MDQARRELAIVLGEARTLLALPHNDFAWSSWEDVHAALADVDKLIATLEEGKLPPRLSLQILFAPTGPMQEVSLSSGWGNEFVALASRSDAIVEVVYNLS